MKERAQYIMDDLDRRIAEELRTDARKSSSQLGKKLGVSASLVRTRLRRLIQTGALRVVAFTNPYALGYQVWANIALKVEDGSPHTVAAKLSQHPACHFVAVCVGNFDIMIAAYFKSFKELDEFTTVEIKAIPGVSVCQTTLFTTPYKYFNFFLNGGSLETTNPNQDTPGRRRQR